MEKNLAFLRGAILSSPLFYSAEEVLPPLHLEIFFKPSGLDFFVGRGRVENTK
jgi:hypothetical protein